MTKELPRYKRVAANAFGWAHRHKVKAVACASLALGGGGAGIGAYLGTHTPDDAARDRQYTALFEDERHLETAQRNFDIVTKLHDAQQAAAGKLTTAVDAAQLDKDGLRLYGDFMAARQKMDTDLMFARDVSFRDMDDIRSQLKQYVGGDAYETGFHGAPAAATLRACQDEVMSRKGFDRSAKDIEDMRSCVAAGQANEDLFLALKLICGVGALGAAYGTARKWHREAAEADAKEAAATAAAAVTPDPVVVFPPLVLGAPTKVSGPLKLKIKSKGVSFA
jgi:hypothetical protein